MKHAILIGMFLLSAAGAGAQDSAATSTTTASSSNEFKKQWIFSASTMIWNEKLELQQGVDIFEDVANFGAVIFMINREFNSENWGVHIGLFTGMGKVNGGGNTPAIDYSEGNVPLTLIGFTPRIYYNLSDRINIGASAFNFIKSMSWPEKTGVRVSSGRNFNSALALDIHYKIFENWELNQGLGGVAEGNTLWHIGVNYRF